MLSQLVEVLSPRRTRRARRLLVSVAERLSEFEPEGDDDHPPQSIIDDQETGDGARDGPKHNEGQHQRGSDQPPDDRKRPERLTSIRPVGTPGLPTPWIRPLNTEPPSKHPCGCRPPPSLYCGAGCSSFRNQKDRGPDKSATNQRMASARRDWESVYEFPFTDEADLLEDAKVEVEVLGRRIDGSIVSISSGRLWLATTEELGTVLKRAVLWSMPPHC